MKFPNNIIKVKFFIYFFSLFHFICIAQNKNYTYTDYYNAKHILNPSFAGKEGALSFYLNSNVSSNSFEKNMVFSVTTPIKGVRSSLGLIVSNDEINITNTFKVSPMYSYQVALNDNNNQLRFGIMSSFESIVRNYDKLTVNPDPFLIGQEKSSSVSIGAGASLYLGNTLMSFTFPYLSKINQKSNADIKTDKIDYYFNSFFSQRIPVSRSLSLMPSILIASDKLNLNSSLVDFNMAGLYNDRFTFGFMVRLQAPSLVTSNKVFSNMGSTYGAFASFKYGDRINIGYSYKKMNLSDFVAISFNSISLRYTFNENISINDIF